MAKEKVICDTDVIIDYWNEGSVRHSNTRHIIEELIEIENVVLSAVSKMELLYGATNKPDLTKIKKNISPIIVALIDNDITLKAMSLIEQYALSHKLALPDAMIAATALNSNLPLFNYNIKDYKFISGLMLYKHK